jgi:DNA repair photolyase
MIREIQAKTLLAHIRHPDPWFGIKYNMNLYRGCEHQCIYCDSRSECYQIEDFRDVLVKANALELLDRELPRKRVKGMVGTGSMNDPYTPAEARLKMTGRALEIIARHGFPVHIITKSDMVVRDLETLCAINERTRAVVSFTVTTADDALSRIVEPGAPPSSARLAALRVLAEHGIYTGVTMMPILPFIEDTEENVTAIVEAAHAAGARYILPGFGMTLRDRQRAWYYDKLDRHFPGLRERYERTFGERYSAPCRNVPRLERLFSELCKRHGIRTRAEFDIREPEQMVLF